jgi:hypothetical protein
MTLSNWLGGIRMEPDKRTWESDVGRVGMKRKTASYDG